jgi:hypothetical protein
MSETSKGPESVARLSLGRLFLSLDQPFKFAARLTSLGAVSVVAAGIIQYSSWRDENSLTRHREELSSAISAFSDINGVLSAAMNLQQILYYTYREAGYTVDISKFRKNYLVMNAKATLTDYFAVRTTLRKSIDVLIAKADLYLDRPNSSQSARIHNEPPPTEPQVFSNRDVLRGTGFNCQQHMPTSGSVPVGGIILNWNQVKHHVGTFYYCLEDLHSSLYPVRIWAAAAAADDDRSMVTDERLKLSDVDRKKIEADFDLQTARLNALTILFTTRIEQIRLRAEQTGFFRHQFCVFCTD